MLDEHPLTVNRIEHLQQQGAQQLLGRNRRPLRGRVQALEGGASSRSAATSAVPVACVVQTLRRQRLGSPFGCRSALSAIRDPSRCSPPQPGVGPSAYPFGYSGQSIMRSGLTSLPSSLGRRSVVALLTWLLLSSVGVAAGQKPEGQIALEAFDAWRTQVPNAALSWNESVTRYRDHLLRRGLSTEQAERTLRLVLAHDEGRHYDKAYAGPPEFQTEPTRLLVEAVAHLKPGRALDVGMGQGRNALFLAQRGWNVTGFDVSAVGLAAAREAASAQGLSLAAIHASDEEFDFGRERWDLIAILYAIEKRSVFRVRDALRPGGVVAVEGAHRSASGGDWEFESNELLRIFEGFRILKYEELDGAYDWAPAKPVRMVRLVAQKPS